MYPAFGQDIRTIDMWVKTLNHLRRRKTQPKMQARLWGSGMYILRSVISYKF